MSDFQLYRDMTVAELEELDLPDGWQEMSDEELRASIVGMVRFCQEKARILIEGPPVGTVMRNDTIGATAHRVPNAKGVPVWKCRYDTGEEWTVLTPTLNPPEQWTCVSSPSTPSHESPSEQSS